MELVRYQKAENDGLVAVDVPWTHEQAVALCRRIAQFAPIHGCHVALTGGALYKDCDILFYRIWQAPKINKDTLFEALAEIGLHVQANFGFVCKAIYETEFMAQAVDIFFPDDPYGGPLFNDEYLAKLNAVKDQLTVAQYNEVVDNHYEWHEQNRGRKL